jgi:hypothetical protein
MGGTLVVMGLICGLVVDEVLVAGPGQVPSITWQPGRQPGPNETGQGRRQTGWEAASWRP